VGDWLFLSARSIVAYLTLFIGQFSVIKTNHIILVFQLVYQVNKLYRHVTAIRMGVESRSSDLKLFSQTKCRHSAICEKVKVPLPNLKPNLYDIMKCNLEYRLFMLFL